MQCCELQAAPPTFFLRFVEFSSLQIFHFSCQAAPVGHKEHRNTRSQIIYWCYQPEKVETTLKLTPGFWILILRFYFTVLAFPSPDFSSDFHEGKGEVSLLAVGWAELLFELLSQI